MRATYSLGEVYDELRDLARRFLGRQRADHTLQPTALVHEAYLRLISGNHLAGMDRARFFATVARAMRSVLVDHARRRGAQKRSPPGSRVPLDDAVAAARQRSEELGQ